LAVFAREDALSRGAGLPPTTANVAKQCGVSRVAIWKLQRRWPWLDAWCDEVMLSANAYYWGAIERRMALTALQGGGSVQHAEMYCRMRSGYYTRNEDRADAPPGVGPNPTIINLLVPRPEMPTIKRPNVTAPAGTAPQIPRI
jgi:hypothetical protein